MLDKAAAASSVESMSQSPNYGLTDTRFKIEDTLGQIAEVETQAEQTSVVVCLAPF